MKIDAWSVKWLFKPEELPKKRILQIDVLRGLAVLGMIIFHVGSVLHVLEKVHINFTDPEWYVSGMIIRFIFFLLVGVSLVLSRQRYASWVQFFSRRMSRASVILFCALLLSSASFFVSPQQMVVFGVLHSIAISLIFWSLLIDIPDYFKWFLTLFFLFFPIDSFITASWWSLPLGVPPRGFANFDWFPLFPWGGLVGLGILTARWTVPFINNKGINPNKKVIKFFAFLGKHALGVYILHLPLLFFLMWLLFFS